jgi:hypothetical protein
MQTAVNLPKSPVPAWRPPGPSITSRSVHGKSSVACRPSIVGGAIPREIMCESGLEKKVAHVLLTHLQVVDLREQPPSVAWIDAAGNQHRHTFDFIATLKDGRKLAVAVKPKDRAERLRLADVLSMIARQLPRGFADGVLLITDADLPRDLIHNAALLHHARRAPDAELDAAVLSLLGSESVTTIGALVRASGRGGDAFRSVTRLIANGAIAVTGQSRIGYATQVASLNCVEVA